MSWLSMLALVALVCTIYVLALIGYLTWRDRND
jgi:uncharacterized iron-regulated membrane protein